MMAAPIQRDNAPALSDTAASMDESPDSAAAMRRKIIPLVDEPAVTVGSLTARMTVRDEQAFNTFHDLYCDRLFRYLIVLCRGDEELSRDLLQITMLKVVRSIRHFSDETAFWNWLAAIARNNFLDFVRKARRRPQFEPILETANLPVSTNDEDRILVDALETALQQLPNDERTLIEAFYFESGSYASLASQCDASPKAVESRLTRVRQKLRQAIIKQLRYENS
jgi:RNA polymerase sigma factor (sigma-70 family)